MSLAAYDARVQELLRANVGEERARAFAAAEYPTAAAERERDAEKASDELERVEQREITKLYRAFGFDVYSTSQYRRAKVTPGIPDLWVMHRALPFAFWHEVKRAKCGQFTAAQIAFAEQCNRAGVDHISGDRRAARTHLIALGLARVAPDGTLEPVRQP